MLRRLIGALVALPLVVACAAPAATPAPTVAPQVQQPAASTDLSGIKTYLLGKTTELQAASATLQQASNRYYELAKAATFDYNALWQSNPAEVKQTLAAARSAWKTASPLYEQMEGIVAGTPSLAQFDVDLDAGAAAQEDPENAVAFDLTLPDGRSLAKPGNLFGVTESTLWGTFADFSSGVQADLDGNGSMDFSDVLPDANVLKGAVDKLASTVAELTSAAQNWTPSESDAFNALVVMVPTMTEYFDSWKNSRFVAGEASTNRDFVAISRLADIQDILSSLEVVHQGVSPLIQSVDASQDAQIGKGLADLKAFVADVHGQEKGGKRFTAEEADLLGAEAQNRATAITGQVSQMAAQLNIKLEN